MADLLTDNEITDFLESNPGWEKTGGEISRTFEFQDFNESLGFVTRVGLKAERVFHHPDIDIRWNKVTLTLSTHSEGGLTGMDIELAGFCDSIA
ncbi:MAG TPA: 4a-hydroxytetrahydrobiopterin dehydratase [Acidimicrobiia bacterium]